MAVRLTESRIPDGFEPHNLGQSTISSDNKVVLISYLSSPLPRGSVNEYVVFVLDNHVKSVCDKYQWVIYEEKMGEYEEVENKNTNIGLFTYSPRKLWPIKIEMNLVDKSGNKLYELSMNQIVVSLDGRVERMIDREGYSAFMGKPATSREIMNDLKDYIDIAIDNGFSDGVRIEIPKALLAAVVYKEALWRPKEWEFYRDYITYISWPTVSEITDWPVRRDVELSMVADELNDKGFSGLIPWFKSPQIDNSLGVCQIKMETLAMCLNKNGSNHTYCEWIEYDKNDGDKDKAKKKKQRLDNFLALTDEEKLDLFNLVRFPKTNIQMCALILHKLKSRNNRWPEYTRNELLSDEKALGIIATEYNLGPTNSPKTEAKPSDYGNDIVRYMGAPFISNFWNRLREPDPYYSYIGCSFTINNGNAIIRDKDASWKSVKYKEGDYIPPGKSVGDNKIIPIGSKIFIEDISDDIKYIYADEFGWTSIENISIDLYNETIGYSPAKYISRHLMHKTVVDDNAMIRTPNDYQSTGEKLPLGALVIVKEISKDTNPEGKYVKVAYTIKKAGSVEEDVGRPTVWTSATNLTDCWVDIKGDNAAWEDGKYIGQLNLVKLVGRESGTDTAQIETIVAEYLEPYFALVRGAAGNNLTVKLNFGFRTFGQQEVLWNKYQNGTGNLAARPGNSNHQSGIAFDLNTGGFNSDIYNWLKANASQLGFIRTVSDEPWHWEYRPTDANEHGYKMPGVAG